MRKKTRNIILISCAFLFLFLAPIVLFYSQGYRIDWPAKKIVKTGAFYFKTYPKSARIFINNKFKEKSDFIFGTSFLENFLPEEYSVEIRKQEYQVWKKKMRIKPGQVTEAKEVILFPEKLDFDLISNNADKVWFSPNKSLMVLKEPSIDNEQATWELKLYNPENKIKSFLLEQQEIGVDNEILDIIWSSDNEKILIQTKEKDNTNYFLVSLKESPLKATPVYLPRESEKLVFDPENSQKIIFSATQENGLTTISEFDITSKTSNKLLRDVRVFAIFEKDIYWIDSKGFLKKTSLKKGTKVLSLIPHPVDKESSCTLSVLKSNVFLDQNDTLFFFKPESRIFKKIADNTLFFNLSPNSKKLCYWNNFEVSIFFIEPEESQPEKEAETKMFLIRFSDKIQEFQWISDHYLIFKFQSSVKVIETDDRGQIQIWDLARFNKPTIFFNQITKDLYVFTENQLFVSNSLKY